MTLQTSGNLDAGDGDYRDGEVLSFDSGGNTVSGGDAVTFDGSGNIQRTSANADDFLGVVLPESDEDDSGIYAVHVAGHVVAVQLASDGSCSEGDLLIPSGTDDGRFNGESGGAVVDTSSGDNAYVNHPIALESGGNDEIVRCAMR